MLWINHDSTIAYVGDKSPSVPKCHCRSHIQKGRPRGYLTGHY